MECSRRSTVDVNHWMWRCIDRVTGQVCVLSSGVERSPLNGDKCRTIIVLTAIRWVFSVLADLSLTSE